MSVIIETPVSGSITIRLSGELSSSEWLGVLRQIVESMPPDHLTSFLVIAEDFQGWQRGGDWGDLSFEEHDDRIVRMAIVADERWRDDALLFAGKGLRKFEIEFFPPAEIDKARAWLASDG